MVRVYAQRSPVAGGDTVTRVWSGRDPGFPSTTRSDVADGVDLVGGDGQLEGLVVPLVLVGVGRAERTHGLVEPGARPEVRVAGPPRPAVPCWRTRSAAGRAQPRSARPPLPAGPGDRRGPGR